MTRTSRMIFCIVFCLLFSGCSQSTSVPTIEITPAEQATVLPTIEGAVTRTEQFTQPSADPDDLLKEAIAALEQADSFQFWSHEVRAYRILNSDGVPKKDVYGEFHTTYTVLREPELKIHKQTGYRFNPLDYAYTDDVYIYQENDKYFSLSVEGSTPGEVIEVDPQLLEPFTGDLFQTLVNYAEQAKFTSEDNGWLVFTLDHPKWYQLNGAIGFADLGLLLLQPNSEQLIEQYVSEHYPKVKTIRFTIYVSAKDQVIKTVAVDDRDFMTSVWAAMDQALIAAGEKPENLTRYEILSENSAHYHIDRYNKVENFDIPGR